MNEDNKKNINQEILYDNKQYDMARRLKKTKKGNWKDRYIIWWRRKCKILKEKI